MRILITGDKGFVGSETRKYVESSGLHGQEHEVIGYDLMDGFDIRDYQQLEAVVRERKPDRILHLAAIARFSDADANPQLAHETNVLGTMNIATVAQKFHIPVVYSSTGSAIMPLDNYAPPFGEDIPARGNSVYGSTKAIGEKYIQEVNPHIVLRYGHLYGAEKRYHGLIGGFLTRIERGMAPKLYGGVQTNSFVYIKDIARANYLALTASWDVWNNIFNIGSPEELSAEDAGQIVCDVFGYKGDIEKEKGRTVDPSRFWMDTKKAELMLKFKCEYSFERGLEDMKKEMQHDTPHS